ncbi:MAG: replication initiation protein [Candidatus Thiodiazotropha endolucinida]|nr:replication initiation protein [Candidatus Thiodiazotropha taylori]MCG8107499.1 replication initiation protein [Candidatus Thiodiazotropha taylori]MCG8111489.1 replication initiation protein [Candidatus Thiodiazotropha taylori]
MNGLYERSITKIEGRKRTDTRWISQKTTYDKGDAYVVVHFSAQVAPYLSELKSRFTSYTMKQVAGLKSPYTIRLLEMLMRWEGSGFFKITLDDLRERMGIEEGRYKKWHDFRKRVVEPAVAELTAQGQWDIKYEPYKKGRSFVGIEFTFEPVDQMPLNLED